MMVRLQKCSLKFLNFNNVGHTWRRHGSVDTCFSTNLRSQVPIPSNPSMLLPFIAEFSTKLDIVLRKGQN